MTLKRILAGALALPAFSICVWAQATEAGATEGAARAASAFLAARQSLLRRQGGVGPDPLFRPPPLRRRERELRVLSRTALCLHGRRRRVHRHQVAEGRTQRPDGDQSCVFAGAVLGRPRHARWKIRPRGRSPTRIEMGMTHDGAVERLKGIAGYRAMFAKAFGTRRNQYRPHCQGDCEFRAHGALRATLPTIATRRATSAP